MNHIKHFAFSALLALVLLPRGASAQGGDMPAAFQFPNPFRAGDSLYEFITTIINQIVLPIGTVLVVLAIIYSGFLFVTAQGNPEQIRKARTNFMWVVVGTAVLLGSWVIAEVVQNTIEGLRA